PKGFEIRVKRDGAKVTGLLVKQPQGDITATRIADVPKMKIDDVIAKVVEAMGGEAHIRNHKTLISTAQIQFLSEGVTGTLTTQAKGPFSSARHTEFRALDRTIGTLEELYDGKRGCVHGSFVSARPMSRAAADETRRESAFY